MNKFVKEVMNNKRIIIRQLQTIVEAFYRIHQHQIPFFFFLFIILFYFIYFIIINVDIL